MKTGTWNWIKGLYLDKPGTPSLTKVLTSIVVLLPITLWTAISINRWVLQPVPDSVVIIILAGIGVKATDRLITKQIESKEDESIR